MSAPVLTVSEQKASLSGKKKKRKTMKNVLGIPSSLKVESPSVELHEARQLIKILERLLPSARLPENVKNSKEQAVADSNQKTEAMKKRNQLSLGVNALNRSIKQELISAVLFANDIQPKFLVHHLNLLCTHNKIPFLQIPGLREVTKNYLGFPCIALGFRKDFSDFSEAIEEVKSISQNKNVALQEQSVEESSESDKEMTGNKIVQNSTKSDEPSFKYLYRTSTKERIFVPENNKPSKQKPKTEFIVVDDNDDDDTESKVKNVSGISSKFMKNEKKKLKNIGKPDDDDDDDDNDDDEDEDLEVPKKKMKKDWVIDTVGTRQRINYYPANVIRFSSNPERNKRKNT